MIKNILKHIFDYLYYTTGGLIIVLILTFLLAYYTRS